MKTLCTAYLAVLLLALHLSSQVIRAQTTAAATDSTNMTATPSPGDNSSMAAMNTTTASPNSGSGITDAFTLLLPLAVASSLLHGCS